MRCPVCVTTDLTMTDRQGVEIDYCPNCRGVWLDRGELDKIIDRSASAPSASPREERYAAPPRGYDSDRRDRYDDDDDRHRHGQYGKRKKRGFLGELFDFD